MWPGPLGSPERPLRDKPGRREFGLPLLPLTRSEALNNSPCWFGVHCSLASCAFKHPPGRKIDGPEANPSIPVSPYSPHSNIASPKTRRSARSHVPPPEHGIALPRSLSEPLERVPGFNLPRRLPPNATPLNISAAQFSPARKRSSLRAAGYHSGNDFSPFSSGFGPPVLGDFITSPTTSSPVSSERRIDTARLEPYECMVNVIADAHQPQKPTPSLEFRSNSGSSGNTRPPSTPRLQSREDAVRYVKTALLKRKENPAHLIDVGYAYLNGFGRVNANYTIAEAIFLEIASIAPSQNMEVAKALQVLGYRYTNRKLGSRNLSKARRLFTSAVDLGLTEASNGLVILARKHWNQLSDSVAAEELFRQAISIGNDCSDDLISFARWCKHTEDNGTSHPSRRIEGLLWLALDSGNRLAMAELGKLGYEWLDKPDPTPSDRDQAERIFTKLGSMRWRGIDKAWLALGYDSDPPKPDEWRKDLR